MQDSIAATASSLQALNEQYRAISHNLANANTAGYKRRVTAFAQALSRQLAGGEPVGGGDLVLPVTGIDYSQAALNVTGRTLDLALAGDGFFVLETPEGPRYTRNGVFVTDDQGRLTDLSGRTVAGEGGPVTIPSSVSVSDVHVSPDGQVFAGEQNVGRLRLVRFDDNATLEPVGDNAFAAGEGAAPAPADNLQVHQGAKEASNVNTVEALIGLIMVTRLYEANLKSIATEDQRTRQLLQVAMS
jgi:flagellar basal-body rod protein FlgF